MLSEIIAHRIINEGPINFRDFMEMALYYPKLGYYTSSIDKIGVKGDYYTCPNLNEAFGYMIGKQIEEMWELSGFEKFTIVEYGAGTGLLCYDILNYFRDYTSLYDRLHYILIEKSPVVQQIERKFYGKVDIHESINDIPPITGCILSNELVDNFPVHQVIMLDELMEVHVGYRSGFMEVLQPASEQLQEYFFTQDITLPRGHRAEVNLDAVRWMKEISGALEKGYVITIDYGYSARELYSRSNGTLTCYSKHSVNEDPYNAVGEQDITAHVNFSALNHWGIQNGLLHSGFTCQEYFLSALGLVEYLNNTLKPEGNILEMAKKITRLKHMFLMNMGNKFKVLIQQKGIKYNPLKGLLYPAQL